MRITCVLAVLSSLPSHGVAASLQSSSHALVISGPDDAKKGAVEGISSKGSNFAGLALATAQQATLVQSIEAPAETADGQTEAVQASDEAAAEESQQDSAKKKEEADVKEQFDDHGATVAFASGKATIAAALEARLSAAEEQSIHMLAVSTKALQDSKDNAKGLHALSAEIQSSDLQAKIYTKTALKSLGEAKQALAEIKDLAKEAAKQAGLEAKAAMQKEADEKWAEVAKFRAKFLAPPATATIAEAAQRAAAPYYKSMQRAMNVRALYSTKAQELASTAADLQRNAAILSSQATVYRASGSPLAPEMMTRAKGMLEDASKMSAEAQQWQTVAASITQQIPTYQVAATAAAARAAALTNPAAQPPVPVGGGAPAAAAPAAAALLQAGARRAPAHRAL